jgi:hypothetical protein
MDLTEVLDDASITVNIVNTHIKRLDKETYPGGNARRPVCGHPTQEARTSLLK